jgi:hypothetical protein
MNCISYRNTFNSNHDGIRVVILRDVERIQPCRIIKLMNKISTNITFTKYISSVSYKLL